MDSRQLRTDALNGQLSIQQLEQLLDALDGQQRTIEQQQSTIEQLSEEVQRLKERLARLTGGDERRPPASAGGSGGTTSQNYSMAAEERRRRKRRKKKSPGRRPNEVKFSQAAYLRDVFPDGVSRDDCRLRRERAVWRLEDGKAVLVGYRIFAGPGGKEGRIEGVTPRCEYGIEILVVLAYLVYIIGISLDKACAVLAFFCQLPLSKSQADALLRQLAQHWEDEFVTLCDLLVYAAVVYMDETSWKVGNEYLSLWALASDLIRVFVYGCNRDKETLDVLLPPDLFEGIGVSDNAAVYGNRFATAQKCWAHLLRKAIKLALLHPRKKKYRRFLDELLSIYRDGKRAAADGRLGEEGRKKRVAELEDRLAELCQPHWRDTTPDMAEHERSFVRLVNELIECMLAEELFTFVLHPEVEPTNNISERNVRNSARDREAGRGSKTPAGAYRRSVIVSVLESLRANLEQFTLASVLAEVSQWMKEGLSLFARKWQELLQARPELEANTS
jgi:transposase